MRDYNKSINSYVKNEQYRRKLNDYLFGFGKFLMSIICLEIMIQSNNIFIEFIFGIIFFTSVGFFMSKIVNKIQGVLYVNF